MNINDPPEKDVNFNANNFNLTLTGIVWKDDSCWFHSALRVFLGNPVFREYLKDFYDKNKDKLQPFDGNDDISNNTNTSLIPENDKEIGWKRFFITLQYFMELQAQCGPLDIKNAENDPRVQTTRWLRNAYARLSADASGINAKYDIKDSGNPSAVFMHMYAAFARYCLHDNRIGSGAFLKKEYTCCGKFANQACNECAVYDGFPNYNSDGVAIGTHPSKSGYTYEISNKKNPNIFTIQNIKLCRPYSSLVNVKDKDGNIVQKKITCDSPVSDVRTIYINGEEYRLVNFSQYRNENHHMIAYGYKDLNSNVLTKFDDLQSAHNNEKSCLDGACKVGYMLTATYVKAKLIGHSVHYNKDTDKPNLQNDVNVFENYCGQQYNWLINKAHKLATDLEMQKIQTIRTLTKAIIDNPAMTETTRDTLKKSLNPFFLPDNKEQPIIKLSYNNDNDNERNSNNIFALDDREKIIKAQETIHKVLKQDPSYKENLARFVGKYELKIQEHEGDQYFDSPSFLDNGQYDHSMMLDFVKEYKQQPSQSLLNDVKISKKDDKTNDVPKKIGNNTQKTQPQKNEDNKTGNTPGKTPQQVKTEDKKAQQVEKKYIPLKIDISKKIEAEMAKYNKKKEDNSKTNSGNNKTQDKAKDNIDKKEPDRKRGLKDCKEEEGLKQKANQNETEYNNFVNKNQRPEINVIVCAILFILAIFPMIIYILDVKSKQKDYDKKKQGLVTEMNKAKKTYEDKKQANQLKYQQTPAPNGITIVKKTNKAKPIKNEQPLTHTLSTVTKSHQQTHL